jgi:hypothetical protein
MADEPKRRRKPLRHFKIFGVALTSTGKPQNGVVTLDDNPEHTLFIVHVARSKGRYVWQLRDVAQIMTRKQIAADVAESKPKRKFKAKRGLVG